MRSKVIAGNWKMYNDIDETIKLISSLTEKMNFPLQGRRVIVCPPFTSLSLAAKHLKDTEIELGAQNMHYESQGAFTGEISATMLLSAGCKYVILGHSERRQYFGETNEIVNKKAHKAIASGLKPIICVGETLEERETGITDLIISAQIRGVLKELTVANLQYVIIAYEPVWAIGTGKTATPDQAESVHRLIRKLIGQLYSWNEAEKMIIQYGGSVKPDNAAELFAISDIDGALVGGACLKADSFIEIVKAGLG